MSQRVTQKELLNVMKEVSLMMHKPLSWDGRKSIHVRERKGNTYSLSTFLYGTKRELYEQLWAIKAYEYKKGYSREEGNKHYWRIEEATKEGQYEIKVKMICATCKKEVEGRIPNTMIEIGLREHGYLPKLPERCWKE